MKVKFNKAALQDALNLVTSVVPSRTPKPILQCLKFVADAGKETVMVSATDLEVGINCLIGQVQVEQEGQFVAPADKIAAIVRESVDDVIEVSAAESTVQIKGADSHFTIYGHDVNQYPSVPGFEGKADFEVDLAKLQESIELSIFAAAKESTRYALNGILWEVEGKKLTLVATDGRRLAKSVVSLESTATLSGGRIIVPAKAMALLEKIGGGDKARVSVRFVENQVLLACEETVISSNLVEGNFPKYEDIIPGDYENKVTLSTDAALSAVRRAALLSNEDSKGIKLNISKDSLVFSSRAPETGDAQIDMKVEYSGKEMEIGFNPQFLIDVLRVIKADIFALELGDPDRPGVIRGGSSFIYIVMPVNL